MGCDQLKGVLYHIPQAFVSQGSNSSDVPPRRRRKRSRLSLHDPSQPKSYRSGYNFFFSEHYALLKPLHYGEEKLICKKIGMLWNNLTEAEKQVCYQTFVSLYFLKWSLCYDLDSHDFGLCTSFNLILLVHADNDLMISVYKQFFKIVLWLMTVWL